MTAINPTVSDTWFDGVVVQIRSFGQAISRKLSDTDSVAFICTYVVGSQVGSPFLLVVHLNPAPGTSGKWPHLVADQAA